MDICLINDVEFTAITTEASTGGGNDHQLVLQAKRNLDPSCLRLRRLRNSQEENSKGEQEAINEAIDVVITVATDNDKTPEGKLVVTGDFVNFLLENYINLIRVAVDVKCILAAPLPSPSTSTNGPTKSYGFNGSYACSRVGCKLLIEVPTMNKDLWTMVHKKEALLAKMKISVHVADVVTNIVTNVHMFNKRILEEEIGSDLTLISKDGRRHKCHKAFLIAHSQVLFGKFTDPTKVPVEPLTNEIKMKELSERGIKALLAWMYYRCINMPSEDCEVAIEMLNAADEYDIPQLVIAMYKVLTAASTVEGWFTIDGAIKLFQVSSQMEYSELKAQAVQILLSKADELDTSRCYQDVFENDPKSAMGLCKSVFLYAKSYPKRKSDAKILDVAIKRKKN